MDEMTSREINRLIEWLKSKGFSADEILRCLEYIGK